MHIARVLPLGLVLVGPSCRYADAAGLDYTELSIERLSSAPAACAGLVFGADGGGFVSSGTKVLRLETKRERGADSTWELVSWAETGEPRGHVILTDGTHVLCDGSRLLRISRDGRHTDVLVGEGLSAPRDLCVAPGGEGVFVADARGDGGALLHVALGTGAAKVLDEDLAQPMGVALAQDGLTLYVIEGASRRVLAYDVTGASSIAARRELMTLPGDEGVAGDVCVDADGFLWIARGSGFDVVGADGRHVVRIPAPPVTSLAFGDESLRVLYFVGAESDGSGLLGRSFVGVRGAPLPAQR